MGFNYNRDTFPFVLGETAGAGVAGVRPISGPRSVPVQLQ